MLPFLGGPAAHAVALDVDPAPIVRMKKYITFPSPVEIHDTDLFPLDQLPAASFDFIAALDALEHVADLPGMLTSLLRLLKHRFRSNRKRLLQDRPAPGRTGIYRRLSRARHRRDQTTTAL